MKEYILEEIGYNSKSYRTKPIKYIISKNNCWECTSHAKMKDGYPRIYRNKKAYGLHRYVYKLFNYGAKMKNKVVMHTCDNPSCINPKHLLLGTQAENILDMNRKGRENSKGRKGKKIDEI